MINRHGTRLDIGTAQDVAQLTEVEAQFRNMMSKKPVHYTRGQHAVYNNDDVYFPNSQGPPPHQQQQQGYSGGGGSSVADTHFEQSIYDSTGNIGSPFRWSTTARTATPGTSSMGTRGTGTTGQTFTPESARTVATADHRPAVDARVNWRPRTFSEMGSEAMIGPNTTREGDDGDEVPPNY